MESTVDQLQAQHRVLETISLQLHQELREGSLAVMLRGLEALRVHFDLHLTFQEERFYPEALQLAEDAGQDCAVVVRLFRAHAHELGEALGNLRERHPHSGTIEHVKAFKDELRAQLQLLSQRLHDEEQTLHPLYDQLRRRFARVG